MKTKDLSFRHQLFVLWSICPTSMRSVRKVTVYICTHNMKAYPDAESAKKAAQEYMEKNKKKQKSARKGRRGQTQTGRVLKAIQNGATTAKEVSRRTRIPLPRVHSLLTYLRKRGRIEGYANDLSAVEKT